jgi:hypothetical protein
MGAGGALDHSRFSSKSIPVVIPVIFEALELPSLGTPPSHEVFNCYVSGLISVD